MVAVRFALAVTKAFVIFPQHLDFIVCVNW